MKKSLLVFFCALLFASCADKNSAQASAAANENQPAAVTPDTVVVKVIKEKPAEDSLLFAYEKTPCFGRCPVYEVHVYKSGYATYEGKNFTEKMGKFSGRLSEAQMNRILQKAREIGYTDLKHEYNTDVTDLPSTYTTFVLNGEKKRIRARASYPDELRELHSLMESIFEEVKWKADALR